MDALDYAGSLKLLNAALTFGINPSLDGIAALTSALGQPQRTFDSMQVTGTNGKTSVVRIASALLSAHGERTGTYTSPHLESYTERISVDGRCVTEAEFASAISAVSQAAETIMLGHAQTLGVDVGMMEMPHTEFEILTAAALWAFRERACSWACLEVGMGGRWDATSVVDPRVAVITGVGLDHTERLGGTSELIAADKAQIIKPGSVAVLGPGCLGVEDVLLARVAETCSGLVRVGLADEDVAWRVTASPDRPGGETRMDVYGVYGTYDDLAITAPSYQAPNVATAIAAVEVALGRALEGDAAQVALERMRFPGRFELIADKPAVVIDGAHNPQAAEVLASAIGEAFGVSSPVVVLGILADKDVEGIVRALAPAASAFVCTQNSSSRCMPAETLAALVERVTGEGASVVRDLESAISEARRLTETRGAGVVITGSLYTAGEARASLR